jgi:hypothetical protein|tara:strand:- start:3 stop:173 length:171 start_codon:yes stop_codon:yes gene_type:complete
MNIQSAQYKTFKDEIVSIKAVIGEQIIIVPLDPANRHYAEILLQVDAGTLTIAAAD